MESPFSNNIKEIVTVDISVQYPDWERIPDIEDIIRVATLCSINSITLPTIATGRELEVSVVLANDELLHVLNREYRDKDTPTNVLTFANLEGEDINTEGVLNLGDVLLSFQTIQRESKEQGKFMLDHLRHLVVHGVLHLIGFDHKEEEEANDMEALEIRILEQLGVQNPYTGTILA